MKILNKKQIENLAGLVVTNQLILNTFDSLEDLNKFSAYGQFKDNTLKILDILGGESLIKEAQEYFK